MDIIINHKQIESLKSAYKKKYVDNSDLYRCPQFNDTKNLNRFNFLDVIEKFGELTNDVFKRETPIGYGEDGSPIQLYTLDKTKTDKPIILIVGGVHGDEKTSIFGIYKTIEILLDSNRWSRFITSNFVIKIIPCLNVYGFNHNKRNNSNDNDLNRDFLKTTQKETKALTKYINKNKDKIKIILDSHNAYNEEFVSCKQEMKYFEEYEDVAFKLNLFLNGKYESDDKKSFLWVSRSKNDGTLSDFINKNKFIGHTVESPRSLTKEIHYPNPINYSDGAQVTVDLLINLMYIYGKMHNQKIMNEEKEYLTEESIISKTCFVLMEEKGINDEVRFETERLIDDIKKRLKTSYLIYDKKRKAYCKVLEFNKKILYNDIKVTVIVYYFDDKEDERILNGVYNGSFSNENKTLKIISSCVNDEFNSYNFYGTIQHELLHMFQSIKTERDNVMGDKDYSLYETSLSMIGNDDKLTKFIGKCIYASFKTEEDAFGNSFYQQLLKTNTKSWSDAYKDTAMYHHINMMRNVLNILKNGKHTKKIDTIINQYLTKHNIASQKLIELIENTIQRYIKRAGKIISLVHEKEKLFEYHFFSTNVLKENEYFDEEEL